MHVPPHFLSVSYVPTQRLECRAKEGGNIDGKKFGNFPPSQGLNIWLYQRLSYKLIGIFFTINSLSCQ